MIKLSYTQILNMEQGLTKVFGHSVNASIEVRRELLVFMKKYNEECKLFNELKEQIQKKYTSTDEKTKKPLIKKEDVPKFSKEYKELLAQVVKLGVKKISTKLIAKAPLSTIDLYNLECVLTD